MHHSLTRQAFLLAETAWYTNFSLDALITSLSGRLVCLSLIAALGCTRLGEKISFSPPVEYPQKLSKAPFLLANLLICAGSNSWFSLLRV